jgi:hypothetical protein
VTRTPAPNAIYPTKGQPFSVIWEDNTDSVVDLRGLLQYARNFEQGLHKPSTSTPPPTSNGARAPGTVVFNGAAALLLRSPPPQDHASQAPAAAAASARAAQGSGIFDSVHSLPGDLVDLLTRNGDIPCPRGHPRDRSPVGSAELPNPTPGPPWHGKHVRTNKRHHHQGFRDSLQAISSPLPSATPRNPSPYISSAPLPNSSRPSLCLIRAAASLVTSPLTRVTFRRAREAPVDSGLAA